MGQYRVICDVAVLISIVNQTAALSPTMAFSIATAFATFICTPSASRSHCIFWAVILLVDPTYIIGSNNRNSFLQWVVVLAFSDWLSRCVARVHLSNWRSAQYCAWYSQRSAVELSARVAFEVQEILNHGICLRTAQQLLLIRWAPSVITPQTVHTLRPYFGDCQRRTRTEIHWKDSWEPTKNIRTIECVSQYFLQRQRNAQLT